MSKIFNSFEKVTIKNAAKAVAHFQAKKQALFAQIEKLESQAKSLDAEIETYEKSVMDITGGYHPLDLCEKVARGNKSQYDWVFKYPNIIPTEEAKEMAPAEETAMPANDNDNQATVAEPEDQTQQEAAHHDETFNMGHEEPANEARVAAAEPTHADPVDDIFNGI